MQAVETWHDALLEGGREAGLDALVDIVLDALRDQLEPLRDDPDLLAVARSSCAANIAVITDLARGAYTLHELEPPPQATAFARELARRNVPVTELARAYRIAQRALWHWGAGEIHRRVSSPDGRAVAIEGLSEAAFATGDVFNSMVMERYAQERERWLRSADAVRDATVRELLAGSSVDPDAASRRVRYELRQEHQAFVVWSEADGTLPEDAAAAVGGPRALIMPMGVGRLVGWAPAGTLTPEAASGAAVALGAPAADVAGFRASHQQAMEAQRVARLLGDETPVTRYDDVALLALLTRDAVQAQAFALGRLGPLADEGEPMQRLRDTLLTVLEEQGSPRRAAHRLGVHENTVAKRLRVIDDLLGADAQRRPAELMAALLILRALGPQAP